MEINDVMVLGHRSQDCHFNTQMQSISGPVIGPFIIMLFYVKHIKGIPFSRNKDLPVVYT